MTPKVSIIVPICNVEKYLRQCLDSIIAQTLTDIEILLINDGSRDGSLAIMQEYAAKDGRIKMMDKPNEGYGKTMNRGLDAATGEYIGIVESDDWIEPDMYERLYALASSHDVQVVKSNYYAYTSRADETHDVKVRFLPKSDLEQVINPKERSDIFYTQPAIWSAIYRRDFLNQYKIRLLESAGASYQDTGFNFKVWAMADKIWLTPEAFLHYRTHDNQSVNSNDKVFCIVDEWAEIERFMGDYPELKKVSYTLRNHVKLGGYVWNLNRLQGEKREAFRKVFAAEYDEAIKNGGIKRDCMQDWPGFQKTLHPQSPLIWLVWVFQKIFIKTKIRSGKKRIYLGPVRIRKTDASAPTFLSR